MDAQAVLLAMSSSNSNCSEDMETRAVTEESGRLNY